MNWIQSEKVLFFRFFFPLKKKIKRKKKKQKINKERKKLKSQRAHGIVYLIRIILIWF